MARDTSELIQHQQRLLRGQRRFLRFVRSSEREEVKAAIVEVCGVLVLLAGIARSRARAKKSIEHAQHGRNSFHERRS